MFPAWQSRATNVLMVSIVLCYLALIGVAGYELLKYAKSLLF